MTYVLGLTGGIATGKSTVSRIFLQFGFPVIDSDLIARQVVEPNTDGLKKIVKEFSEDVLYSDGSLDRKKLGELIFSDADKRVLLDELLDAEIRKMIKTAVQEKKSQAVPLVVVDIPLLFEADYQDEVDQVMLVYLPEFLQEQRLMERNKLSKKAAIKRMNSQISIEAKKARADFVIDNSGSIEETKEQVKKWLDQQRFDYIH